MRSRLAVRSTVVLVALVFSAGLTPAQDDPRPGFNLFTVQQDIEIGRQSAAQAERQLPVLRDASIERYLNDVARALVAGAPGARYPYRVRAVDSTDINAFTFPGGFLYVNRGLLEATRNESELAGVLAHEIAHVALRHGTHQASKAYAAQAGLGILGGLLGRGGNGRTGQIVEAVGGLGLNAVFLKFSRNDEHEADLVGVRMMQRAGYDTSAMASFFELLRQQQARDPGKLEQFFSSHPAPADRAARIRAEAERLGPPERRRESSGFALMQDELPATDGAPSGGDEPRATGRRGFGLHVDRPSVVAAPDVRAEKRLLRDRVSQQLARLPGGPRLRGRHRSRGSDPVAGRPGAEHRVRRDPQPLRSVRRRRGRHP
jgi:beta-barrel assembly-enhancing protease